MTEQRETEERENNRLFTQYSGGDANGSKAVVYNYVGLHPTLILRVNTTRGEKKVGFFLYKIYTMEGVTNDGVGVDAVNDRTSLLAEVVMVTEGVVGDLHKLRSAITIYGPFLMGNKMPFLVTDLRLPYKLNGMGVCDWEGVDGYEHKLASALRSAAVVLVSWDARMINYLNNEGIDFIAVGPPLSFSDKEWYCRVSEERRLCNRGDEVALFKPAVISNLLRCVRMKLYHDYYQLYMDDLACAWADVADIMYNR